MEREKELVEKSRKWVKDNKREIINKFISGGYTSVEKPFTIFMAGSPGAGKTETSREFINSFGEVSSGAFIARIDPDEVREMIDGYNGSNAELFQSATSLGVEKVYDYVLSKNINAVVDGTLASYDVAKKNIERSLKKKRETAIFYVYQDPLIAWGFTKAREKEDGRHIPKEAFIESFFAARDNANKLKNIFKDKLMIFVIKKNFSTGEDKFYFNAHSIDNYIKMEYTKDSLNQKIC